MVKKEILKSSRSKSSTNKTNKTNKSTSRSRKLRRRSRLKTKRSNLKNKKTQSNRKKQDENKESKNRKNKSKQNKSRQNKNRKNKSKQSKKSNVNFQQDGGLYQESSFHISDSTDINGDRRYYRTFELNTGIIQYLMNHQKIKFLKPVPTASRISLNNNESVFIGFRDFPSIVKETDNSGFKDATIRSGTFYDIYEDATTYQDTPDTRQKHLETLQKGEYNLLCKLFSDNINSRINSRCQIYQTFNRLLI